MSKKIFAFVISLVMLLSLAGCAFSAAILPIKLENGDSFNVKMSSDSRSLSVKFDENGNDLLKLYENDEAVLIGGFQTKDSMEDYIEIVLDEIENKKAKIVDNGESNGMRYTLISFKNSKNEKVYEFICWIVGSNTGFIADVEGSESEAIEIFESLTFEVTKTKQTKDNYCFKNIDDFEDLMD